MRVDVQEPPSQVHPDLVVTSPSVSDSSPATGTQFTLSATVRNYGGAASAATTLRYYRSTDATSTTTDMGVGADAVAELAASGNSNESTALTAPSLPGTYYYGACADAVAEESDPMDNCSSSVQVTISAQVDPPETQGHPNLVVTSPSVSDSSPPPGRSLPCQRQCEIMGAQPRQPRPCGTTGRRTRPSRHRIRRKARMRWRSLPLPGAPETQ